MNIEDNDLIDIVTISRDRASRLRRLRSFANLSRKELCEGANININTYIGYEVGRYGGLTKKGAERVLPFLATKGVYSNLDWLMQGIGPGPKIVSSDGSHDIQLSTLSKMPDDEKSENELIADELFLFHKHYKQAIDCKISDDGMLPKFQIGDVVAGVQANQFHVSDLIGHDCIILTAEKSLVVRNLRKGRIDGHYTLVCINPDATVDCPIVHNIEVLMAVPIIWHRKSLLSCPQFTDNLRE